MTQYRKVILKDTKTGDLIVPYTEDKIVLPIGYQYSLICTESYIPEGSLLCDGAEYAKEQFNDFFDNYLNDNLLETCTYEQYQQELNTYGFCNKFGMADNTFKVPTAKQIDRYLIKKKEPTETDMTWYNIYSDGYIEQGGTVVSGAVSSYIVEFPHEMRDLSYTPQLSPFIGASDDTGADDNVYSILSGKVGGSYPYAKALKHLRVSTLSKANAGFNWSVTGYIALEAYPLPRQFVVVANGSVNKSMFDWAEWYSSLKDIKDTVDNFSTGQWIPANNIEIVNITSSSIIDSTIDLSDILIEDSQYEIFIKNECSNTLSGFVIDTSICEGVMACNGRFTQDILPIGKDKTIRVYTAQKESNFNIKVKLYAYKKL